MFVFNQVEGPSPSIHEFDITGSTYAPEGDVYMGGTKTRCSDYEALSELATICALCNDSSVDFNDVSRDPLLNFLRTFEFSLNFIALCILIPGNWSCNLAWQGLLCVCGTEMGTTGDFCCGFIFSMAGFLMFCFAELIDIKLSSLLLPLLNILILDENCIKKHGNIMRLFLPTERWYRGMCIVDYLLRSFTAVCYAQV